MTANPIRIALFCGGRGSATIIRALLRHAEIDLILIVNAYDDGLSTGALRNFIPGMLGPSDFRKNFSHLLGNYSNAQYALKNLMEYRLPAASATVDMETLARHARSGNPESLAEPLKSWFAQLSPALSAQMRALLGRFFDHAASVATVFDYRDCSLGNLVFAGAYLQAGRNFNAAAAMVGDLVGSRARLLNVSEEENRFLAALKADGTFLATESEIVGPQSASPITDLYLLEKPLSPDEVAALSGFDAAGRKIWLAARDAVPSLSSDVATALAQADIILYGPGTQHSSLLPSYRIARAALANAPARVKALVMNLDGDNDIQDLTAADVAQAAIAHGATITHLLLNQDEVSDRLPPGDLGTDTWRGARVARGRFATPYRARVHNGGAIVDRILALWTSLDHAVPSVEVFADIQNRAAASDELIEEFLETDWRHMRAHLTLNRIAAPGDGLPVATAQYRGLFPETAYLRDWLAQGGSDYLVMITGDGAYSFRDVQNIIHILEQQPSLGGVFGSRTQSRRQFITSIRAAYGENRLLYWLGKIAAFLFSALFYLRSGVIFSDPLTGLRVFRRKSLPTNISRDDAPLALLRHLIRRKVEVAELPVLYRTFSGFTDPHWRIRRAFRNLASLLSW